MEPVERSQYVRWLWRCPFAVAGAVGPAWNAAHFVNADGILEAWNRSPAVHERSTARIDQIQAGLRDRRGGRDTRRKRTIRQHIRKNEPCVLNASGRPRDDDITSAGERRGACLVEDYASNAEQRSHDGDAAPETSGKDEAADRPRQQRAERQRQDHWHFSSIMRPSRILSRRCARDATAGSCVTTTTAVPSACSRSSSWTICSPVA